jgi:hypothetical protein
MTTKMTRLCSVAALAVLVPVAAHAHVSVWPRESSAGATEKYTVRVPTEGKVATIAAELEVPAGVVVEVVAMPRGWKHDIKRQGDRIVGITWSMEVPPDGPPVGCARRSRCGCSDTSPDGSAGALAHRTVQRLAGRVARRGPCCPAGSPRGRAADRAGERTAGG